MSDITMCKSKVCPFSKDCYRKNANPGHWQSYFATDPFDDEEVECDYYYYIPTIDIFDTSVLKKKT